MSKIYVCKISLAKKFQDAMEIQDDRKIFITLTQITWLWEKLEYIPKKTAVTVLLSWAQSYHLF